MYDKNLIRGTFARNDGILRLMPNFVAYQFSKPGFRLKLHPDDYYAYGTKRGAIKERLLSTVMNPVSYVVTEAGPVSLRDFVTELGAELIGGLMEKHHGWPMHAKFFDYGEPLFHHIHLGFDDAARIGQPGKPEAYYYPPQLNNYPGAFPHTYFGFDPGTTKEMVKERLLDFEKRDVRLTELSRAFRIELGTGWYTPPGVLHAPGSYCTYEPQWNSTAGAVFENVTAGEVNSYDQLSSGCPEDKKRDIDYIISLLDWDKNVDPHFKEHNFRPPVVCASDERHIDKWIAYGNEYFSAKELTVYPGQSVTVKDEAAYGCVFIQGHGKFGPYDAEAPVMFRFGQATADEYFVSEKAAREGVTVINPSACDPLVMLRHFADNNLYK
ncbi:MAG: hypothetical protein FWF44_02415 [Defluviitaleaceae bacterium]|nr:hypothetical protein [Defluviitaleaceae bacterium]